MLGETLYGSGGGGREIGRGELCNDARPVEPDVLAAYEPVTKLKDMEHPKRDPASVAGHSEKLARDRSGPRVFDDACIVAVVAVERNHRFGFNVLEKMLVEALRSSLAMHGAGREADNVVFDVVGVHRDTCGG